MSLDIGAPAPDELKLQGQERQADRRLEDLGLKMQVATQHQVAERVVYVRLPSKVAALRPSATMHNDRDWISSQVGPAG